MPAGIRAVFAFPLRLGAARLGALTLYQAHPGSLDDDIAGDAVIAAEVITRGVLARQAGTPGETLTAELSAGVALQAEVHQASGMVSVQLGVGVIERPGPAAGPGVRPGPPPGRGGRRCRVPPHAF